MYEPVLLGPPLPRQRNRHGAQQPLPPRAAHRRLRRAPLRRRAILRDEPVRVLPHGAVAQQARVCVFLGVLRRLQSAVGHRASL